MLVTLQEILHDIKDVDCAVAAFNVYDFADAMPVVQAAEDTKLPVVLMANKMAVEHTPVELLGPLFAGIAKRSSAKVCVHLDHSTSFDLIQRSIMANFSSVMFDGSQLSYADNVAQTRLAVKAAHACGVSVEAEIGAVGYADGTAYNPSYTSPELAAQFEADAKPDCLAVAVGTVHRMTTQAAQLDFALLDAIRKVIDTPIVIHGSTGVVDEDLQKLVLHGVKKVNIGTQLRISFGNAMRAAFAENPQEYDRLKLYPLAREAVYQVARKKMELLSPYRGW